MQEQAVMEIIKWFMGLFLVLGLVAVGIFLFQVQEVNGFRQQINYAIEREGGLTPEALERLEEFSRANLSGTYAIESDQLGERVNFGEIVEYTLVATYEIAFFPVPDVVLRFRGLGVSKVR